MIGQLKAFWAVPSQVRCIEAKGVHSYCLRTGVKFFSLEEAMQKKCGGVYEIEFEKGKIPKNFKYHPKN